MARIRETIAQNEIKTITGFPLVGDFVNLGERCYYTPIQAGDAADTWPEGYVGLPWPRNGIIKVAAGERITVKSLSGNAIIEGHEAGA